MASEKGKGTPNEPTIEDLEARLDDALGAISVLEDQMRDMTRRFEHLLWRLQEEGLVDDLTAAFYRIG